MWQGCRWSVCGNIFETIAPISRNSGPQGTEFQRCVPFAHRFGIASFCRCHAVLKPFQKALNRKSVLYKSLAKPLYFRVFLYSFAQNDRGFVEMEKRGFITVWKAGIVQEAVELPVERGWVGQKRLVRAEFTESRLHRIVILNAYVISHKFLKTVGGITVVIPVLLHEPAHILLRNKKVGYNVRIVFDVVCADIKQPGNLVKRGKQEIVHRTAEHPLAQPRDFAKTALPSRDLDIESLYRSGRDCGAVCPELANKIRSGNYFIAEFFGRSGSGKCGIDVQDLLSTPAQTIKNKRQLARTGSASEPIGRS